MLWIAPSEKDAASTSLEKRLWDAADQFRANSGLKAQEYSGPILGLISLRFAEVRRAVTGISDRMLSQTLQRLEADGLVARTQLEEIPPRVDYNLTGIGQPIPERICDLIDAMSGPM